MKDLLKRLLESRFLISTQLYIGIGGGVALTIVASLVGWVSFARVSDVQSRVNEDSVPKMAAAFGAAQQSGALVDAALRLTTAVSPEDLARVVGKIDEDRKAFETQLAALTRKGGEVKRSKRIRARGDALITNIKAIEDSVEGHFALTNLQQALRRELAALRSDLTNILIPSIDDQLFYAMTGYDNLNDVPAPRAQHFSQAEFNRYRHLAELQADATIGDQILATAFNVSDIPLLEPLRERFESTASGIERRLSVLGSTAMRQKLSPLFTRLIELGIGPEGGFNLRSRELALDQYQRDLLAHNRVLAIELVSEVESLVSAAHASVRDASLTSARTILTGRNLLFALSVISVVGAVLIAWLFVGRVLSRRLGQLSDRMRRMAKGDLEATVDISGSDEIADMAAALEVFRRHALEVQRLNLVEKLAEELKGKNDQLAGALADLERAQDQLIMREKLASLGELTAGVAHEIKNPLNFIKNFSEVSEELLEELLEEIPKPTGEGGEESRELIDEISSDLTDNLKRIHEHGERANRIVQSMLMMGRHSGERQPTDINALLSEHTLLAYHSARVTDPTFRLKIEEHFDPEVGEHDVIQQNLGRVFLNMASNACHATDEKRRAVETGNGKSPDSSATEEKKSVHYEPTLRLTTRRMADCIQICIRDNGNGIPPDVIEKIFTPFFTTKPTNQGTGLGLALSNDIVREHGGSIRVESAPPAFTEMIIELPTTSSPSVVETLSRQQ